jgi:excinuclease ABC subunit A
MSQSTARGAIRLRGVRHNNLKNFDLDLPLRQLIVITGLSGSGKSSLAFDTLFAEGQRRYIETFSPYARQFFDRMDKPRVDSIEGIPPAIAIEQRNSVKSTRSTVGTMTELCDYMKMLWPHVAQLHCRGCGKPVTKESPQTVWECLQRLASEKGERNGGPALEYLITFELPLSEKLSFADSLGLISKQGYQRLLVNGKVLRLDELLSQAEKQKALTSVTVVQDRVKLAAANRARFVEACEQAYHYGKGKLSAWPLRTREGREVMGAPELFSNRFHCATCDIEYREASPALFSFNHPVGACPKCRAFGRVISIDYDLALPDWSKTIAQCVVRPWQSGTGAESHADLLRACRELGIPLNVPFNKLAKKWQDFVINGDPDYGKDEEHEWPSAWYGVKGYFRWLESKAYKMHVRVLLSRYRAYTTCPDCKGQRFQPDSLLYKVRSPRRAEPANRVRGLTSAATGDEGSITLSDFYQLPIRDAVQFISALAETKRFKPSDPIALIFQEVRSRLSYLYDVGLGYLNLDRPTRSLSGGETERVNLTTCLGTRLVNTLFVLDEPSVGLHPRDTQRLVRILEQLRDAGNTVVVVEHESSVMRAADQIVDLGPGHGATGGELVFQGGYREILKSKTSLTGKFLSGRESVPIPNRRPVLLSSQSEGPQNFREAGDAYVLNDAPRAWGNQQTPALKLSHATRHNLNDVCVEIPLGRLVCVTGVSGSGKTTLIREVLLPVLTARLADLNAEASMSSPLKASERIESEDGEEEKESAGRFGGAELEGAENLSRAILVDQSSLGKTPRSNPAVYIGAFDDIREFFAQSEQAEQRGLNASAFSFNSAQGQCERCRGAGYEKIEMQFLSDVFVRCPECDGRRYRNHILEVKIAATGLSNGTKSFSIGDLLDATVEEAVTFLSGFEDSKPARRAQSALQWLIEVGLGYLKLGQPINTLSGGESQRLKLVRHLAEAEQAQSTGRPGRIPPGRSPIQAKPTLFLFDEPTTGLHFHDVRVLLQVFQRLVDAGHSVLVIEHNLDVIKSADWVIDLGPDAGDEGGRLVVAGTPEEIANHQNSHTGAALCEILGVKGRRSKAVQTL